MRCACWKPVSILRSRWGSSWHDFLSTGASSGDHISKIRIVSGQRASCLYCHQVDIAVQLPRRRHAGDTSFAPRVLLAARRLWGQPESQQRPAQCTSNAQAVDIHMALRHFADDVEKGQLVGYCRLRMKVKSKEGKVVGLTLVPKEDLHVILPQFPRFCGSANCKLGQALTRHALLAPPSRHSMCAGPAQDRTTVLENQAAGESSLSDGLSGLQFLTAPGGVQNRGDLVLKFSRSD